MFAFIEEFNRIIVGIDRDLSAFERMFYISLKTMEGLSCLDPTLKFEHIEFFL